MRGQWASRGRLHLCVHLPAIHAYTNSASSVANCDRDSNSYTYFDTETFTDAEICANPKAASHSGTAPVTFLDENKTDCSTRTSGREHAKDFGVRPCPPACSRRLSE